MVRPLVDPPADPPMRRPLPIGVLASGEGTNLQALIDSVHGVEAEIVGVASDRPSARALARAQAAGIPERGVPARGRRGARGPRPADRRVDLRPGGAADRPGRLHAAARPGFPRLVSGRRDQRPSVPAAGLPGARCGRAGAGLRRPRLRRQRPSRRRRRRHRAADPPAGGRAARRQRRRPGARGAATARARPAAGGRPPVRPRGAEPRSVQPPACRDRRHR